MFLLYIKKLKNSRWWVLRQIFVLLSLLKHLAWLIFAPSYRAEWLTGLKHPHDFLQRSGYTRQNRYPLLFAQCAQVFMNQAEVKIMSYGCSTGEEVFSIAGYLPSAQIVGVDINAWSLKQARRHDRQNRYRFIERFSAEFNALDNFDAIFCMAVFQRTENRTSPNNTIAKGFTYKQFDAELQALHLKLKIGGLLFIDHSDFAFADFSLYHCYEPLPFDNNQLKRNRPLFNTANIKVAEEQFNYRAFVKNRA
jgi:hypothetical protein